MAMRIRPIATTLVGLALATTLSACGAKDAAWVHDHLDYTENFHAGTKVLETPALPDTGPHRATLRATARTRGKRVGADVELAVRAEFDDFSFLDRVSFASGRAYPIDVEKRETEDCGTTDRSLCNVQEFVSVKLSRKFLRAKRASGFNVKLWGRRESVVLFVPPEYIEGLLARMENRSPDTTIGAAAASTAPAAPAPDATRRR
jgi:hypothetical protein